MFLYLIKTGRNYCLFTVISQGTQHVMTYYLLNLLNDAKEDIRGLDDQTLSSFAPVEMIYCQVDGGVKARKDVECLGGARQGGM